MKFLPLLVALSVAASSSARSEETQIATQLVTISLAGGVPVHYYRNQEKLNGLEISAQGIGAPVAYRGDAVLALYEHPPELTEDAPEPDLKVALPADQDRVLLVFYKTQDSKLNVRAMGISSANMKPGDYRIFNFSGKKAYIVMNEVKSIVHPGKPMDISSTSWQSETLDMEVRFGLREGENLRQVYSTVWGHRATRRTFLFILDRADEFNPFEIRRYYDVVPKIPATSHEPSE